MLPQLKGKLDGVAVRAPIPTGSITDLVVTLGRDVTAEEINAAYKAAAAGPLAGILAVLDRPARLDRHQPVAVLVHLRQRPDDGDGTTAKVFGWYDNEWGYSCRLVDLIEQDLCKSL